MHVQIDHPCVQHKLAIIRDIETGHKRFRELATEITEFLCYEALKNIKTREVEVQTPMATAKCRKIDTDIVVVPILRAGVGMLEGILELIPTARVGFVGLYRDEETKRPVSYYDRSNSPDVWFLRPGTGPRSRRAPSVSVRVYPRASPRRHGESVRRRYPCRSCGISPSPSGSALRPRGS